MIKRGYPFKSLIWPCIVLLLVGGLLTACNPEMAGKPRVWIDVPRPNVTIRVGQAVDIQGHAYASDGVAEVLFTVNGTPCRREPPQKPGAEFTPIVQRWLPDKAGDYHLQIEVYDSNGAGSSPASVWVKVISAEVAPLDHTLTPTQSPIPPLDHTLTPTQSPIPLTNTTSPSLTPTLTLIPPTHTPSPLPPATSTPIPPTPKPSPTTDSTSPTIGNVSESADPIFKPFCTPNTLTISASVADLGGVSKVELVYRVVEGTRQGQWRRVTMNLTGGNTYQATLNWEDLEASLDPPVNSQATIEYYLQAWDSNNNQSQSNTYTTALKNCLV